MRFANTIEDESRAIRDMSGSGSRAIALCWTIIVAVAESDDNIWLRLNEKAGETSHFAGTEFPLATKAGSTHTARSTTVRSTETTCLRHENQSGAGKLSHLCCSRKGEEVRGWNQRHHGIYDLPFSAACGFFWCARGTRTTPYNWDLWDGATRRAEIETKEQWPCCRFSAQRTTTIVMLSERKRSRVPLWEFLQKTLDLCHQRYWKKTLFPQAPKPGAFYWWADHQVERTKFLVANYWVLLVTDTLHLALVVEL